MKKDDAPELCSCGSGLPAEECCDSETSEETETEPLDVLKEFQEILAIRSKEAKEENLPDDVPLLLTAVSVSWEYAVEGMENETPGYERLDGVFDLIDVLHEQLGLEKDEEAWDPWPCRLPFDVLLPESGKTPAELLIEEHGKNLPPGTVDVMKALCEAYDDAGAVEERDGKPFFRSFSSGEAWPLIAGFGAPAGQAVYGRVVVFRGVAIPVEAHDLGPATDDIEKEWVTNLKVAVEVVKDNLAGEGLSYRDPRKGIELALMLLQVSAEAEEKKQKAAKGKKKPEAKKGKGKGK